MFRRLTDQGSAAPTARRGVQTDADGAAVAVGWSAELDDGSIIVAHVDATLTCAVTKTARKARSLFNDPVAGRQT
jgi:hypothetical protein